MENNIMEILQFVFQSFWHFIGTAILLSTVGSIIVGSIRAIFSRNRFKQ